MTDEIEVGEPHLKFGRDGGVVVLTMNNPRRKNALTPEMIMLVLIAGAGSTVRLKRQIPYTKAMEMILTGEPLTAHEAYHFGLVGHVVPRGQSLAKAREIAARVAANGPLAVRNAKASILASGWLDDADARKIEQRFVVEVMTSQDAKEGLSAFAAKRDPRFTGK
jgi:enoyl-CoA hydratase